MSTCCTTGILGLLCQNHCSIQKVFALMAFQPPPASYTVDTGTMTIVMDELLAAPYRLNEVAREVQCFAVPNHGDPQNGTTNVFFLRKHGATRTILYSHANGSDCGLSLSVMQYLREHTESNVVFYEYDGYAGQRRSPSVESMERNAIAAYHKAIELTPGGAQNLIVYGQSLGSHPTCFLASRFPVSGAVVHSGVASGMQVVFGPRECCTLHSFLCACDSLRNEVTIKHIRAPVCVIHGCMDEVVEFWHGQRLNRRAPRVPQCGPLWLPDAGHNDTIELYPTEIATHLVRFFDELAVENEEKSRSLDVGHQKSAQTLEMGRSQAF